MTKTCHFWMMLLIALVFYFFWPLAKLDYSSWIRIKFREDNTLDWIIDLLSTIIPPVAALIFSRCGFMIPSVVSAVCFVIFGFTSTYIIQNIEKADYTLIILAIIMVVYAAQSFFMLILLTVEVIYTPGGVFLYALCAALGCYWEIFWVYAGEGYLTLMEELLGDKFNTYVFVNSVLFVVVPCFGCGIHRMVVKRNWPFKE